jgi:hypothetical protein
MVCHFAYVDSLSHSFQDFQDEDLEEADHDFARASVTPLRIHGKGAMVYWMNCTVSLMKLIDGELVHERDIERRSGKGRLDVGLALIFIGEGGKVKR